MFNLVSLAYLVKSDVANKNKPCLLYSVPRGVYIKFFWGWGGGNLCDGKPEITQIRLQLFG
jgi:hypothetical protein